MSLSVGSQVRVDSHQRDIFDWLYDSFRGAIVAVFVFAAISKLLDTAGQSEEFFDKPLMLMSVVFDVVVALIMFSYRGKVVCMFGASVGTLLLLYKGLTLLRGEDCGCFGSDVPEFAAFLSNVLLITGSCVFLVTSIPFIERKLSAFRPTLIGVLGVVLLINASTAVSKGSPINLGSRMQYWDHESLVGKNIRFVLNSSDDFDFQRGEIQMAVLEDGCRKCEDFHRSYFTKHEHRVDDVYVVLLRFRNGSAPVWRIGSGSWSFEKIKSDGAEVSFPDGEPYVTRPFLFRVSNGVVSKPPTIAVASEVRSE